MSLAKTSELADVGMWEFADVLRDMDILVIDYDDEELNRKINTARDLLICVQLSLSCDKFSSAC